MVNKVYSKVRPISKARDIDFLRASRNSALNNILYYSKEGMFEEAMNIIEDRISRNDFHTLMNVYLSKGVPNKIKAEILSSIKNAKIKKYLKECSKDPLALDNLSALFYMTSGIDEKIFNKVKNIEGFGSSTNIFIFLKKTTSHDIFIESFYLYMKSVNRSSYYKDLVNSFRESKIMEIESELVFDKFSIFYKLKEKIEKLESDLDVFDLFSSSLSSFELTSREKVKRIADNILLSLAVVYTAKHGLELSLNLLREDFVDLSLLKVFSSKFEINGLETPYTVLLKSLKSKDISHMVDYYKSNMDKECRNLTLKYVYRFLPDTLKRDFFSSLKGEPISLESLSPLFNKGLIRDLIGDEDFKKLKFIP